MTLLINALLPPAPAKGSENSLINRKYFLWQRGAPAVDAIKIGETPIEDFEDVETETRQSTYRLGRWRTAKPTSERTETMHKLLSGQKSYVMGTLMVLLGIVGLIVPEALIALELPDSPSGLIAAGLTTIFLRAGIAKS